MATKKIAKNRHFWLKNHFGSEKYCEKMGKIDIHFLGAMARSNFLMSRKKVLKVTVLKELEEDDGGTDPFAAFAKKGNNDSDSE